jgi:magnesium transporter
MHLTVRKSFTHRLPWLLIGLFGGIFAAKIVSSFEEVLSRNIVLAAFIPLIVYMSDAVGTQMESFIIRDSAMHPRLNLIKYFLKHLSITFLISAILSGALYFYSFFTYSDPKLSFVLSFSMFVSILSSVFTGLLLPMVFKREHFDPANAAGPIATIIQDILSVLVYFLIASALL